MSKTIIIIIFFLVIIIFYVVTTIYTSEKYKALQSLCNLSKEQIDSFFNAYDKVFDDESMISTLEDYHNKKPVTSLTIPEDKKPSEYVADAYSILNLLCALGNVKKMYIPNCMDLNKSLIRNQELHEMHIAKKLNVKNNSTILDLGCGCGRIAYHISKLTNSTVYGVNIDNIQLNDAKIYAKKKNSSDKLKFIFCDFNDELPFKNHTFDAIYTFQAFIPFISNFKYTFNQLFRILKPGGRIVFCEPLLLDNFDRSNKHHLKLIKNARKVLGGANWIHYKYVEDFGKKAGLNVILRKNKAEQNLAKELPMLKSEHKNYEYIQKIIKILTALYILPKHLNDLIKQLRFGAEDYIEMCEKNLFTANCEVIFEKPK